MSIETATPPANICQSVYTSCTTIQDRAVISKLNISCPTDTNNDTTTPSYTLTSSPTIRYPTCETLSSTSICSSIITNPIYITPTNNKNQTTIEKTVLPSKTGELLISSQPICLDIYRRMVCGSAYTQCQYQTYTMIYENTTVDINIPYMIRPCYSLCQQFQRVCPSLITSHFPCDAYTNITSCDGSVISSTLTYPNIGTNISSSLFPSQSSMMMCSNVTTTPIPITPSSTPICVPLPSTSVCANVVSYAISNSTCIATTEAMVDTRTWSSLSTTCRNAIAMYQCVNSYQACNSTHANVVMKPTTSVCQVSI